MFSQDALPIDDDIVWRLFGEEVTSGEIPDPMSIADVWKNSYSENTSRKVWGAKYVARHPNLVALELSSFKCGHDAPIYTVVEEIVEHSGTPYFCFKDIDENKPTGSIRIRTETIGYFLKRYREDMVANKKKTSVIEVQLKEFEDKLRRQLLKEKLAAMRAARGARGRRAADDSREPRATGGFAASGAAGLSRQRRLKSFVGSGGQKPPHPFDEHKGRGGPGSKYFLVKASPILDPGCSCHASQLWITALQRSGSENLRSSTGIDWLLVSPWEKLGLDRAPTARRSLPTCLANGYLASPKCRLPEERIGREPSPVSRVTSAVGNPSFSKDDSVNPTSIGHRCRRQRLHRAE